MRVETLHQTNVPGVEVRRGKVRDIYDLGDRVLIVATDRISAFDCVLPDAIPQKGRVLTGLSKFWFERFSGRCPHHLIEVVDRSLPGVFGPSLDQFRGRAMLCRKAEVVPIECVARGYLAGSGWREYVRDGSVCGVKLPSGLVQCDRLPAPIFTPATKADSGHDENISFEQGCALVGAETMRQLRDRTLDLYAAGAEYALTRGIIIADTKFEFGRVDGELVLIDEVLTPDSSRFWPADRYERGRDQESYDKQFVRNHLQAMCDRGAWDKTDPAPSLPAEVIASTSVLYRQAYEQITGTSFIL
ncbi:MAG: phosphoribosylaminoimidazolesuccinocarboxamide synthase [Planctomycetota bacterium]|nr:phosphoribosylaminoimidazolesuccinocarboxamide synthase [Planctomycetota bacterium]